MKTSMRPCEATASERAFLGAVISGDAQAGEHRLAAHDFADGFCRTVFEACAAIETQGKQVDLVTLSDAAPGLDTQALVALCAEAAGVGALAAQYAQNIRDASQRRLVSELCRRGMMAAQDGGRLLEETIDKLRAALERQSLKAAQEDAVSGTDAITDFLLWFDQNAQGKATAREAAISTGLAQLDRTLDGGLRAGRFYVVGARTGVGKSALLGAIAALAVQRGRRVLYVSCEMGVREVATRMAARLSGVRLSVLTGRERAGAKEQEAVVSALAGMPSDRLHISVTANTPAAIRRAAMKLRAGDGLDLIVVDYIQILRPDVKSSSRVEAVGEITRALKLTAMELGVPVLAAAQLSRASALSGEMPRLTDLRESGSIEQDADAVMLLHQVSDEKTPVKALQLAVAKNRQGECAFMRLCFDPSRMLFAAG